MSASVLSIAVTVCITSAAISIVMMCAVYCMPFLSIFTPIEKAHKFIDGHNFYFDRCINPSWSKLKIVRKVGFDGHNNDSDMGHFFS